MRRSVICIARHYPNHGTVERNESLRLPYTIGKANGTLRSFRGQQWCTWNRHYSQIPTTDETSKRQTSPLQGLRNTGWDYNIANWHICATSGFPHQGSEWGDDANTPSASNGMVKAIYVVRGSVEITIPGRYRTVNHGTVLTSQLDHTWSPLLTLRAREDKDPSRLQYQCYGHTQVDTRMITQVSTCEGEHWHVPK